MTGYIHSHPGGAQMLQQCAGRDATDDFYDAHADCRATLKANSTLKVGCLVEERSRLSDIDIDEIVLFDRVYCIPCQCSFPTSISSPVP